jgi:glycosyltransferase involved in cell wall biosynthesis
MSCVIVRESLSVVMPVYNEAAHLAGTIDALATALDDSGFEAELVLVDDGSTDGSADAARAATDGRIELQLLSQANRGRFEARRAGLASAKRDYVLFLDSRVQLGAGALRFVHGQLGTAPVWNGHVDVVADSPYGEFWRLLAELAWRDYFDEPRTTTFGIEEFDRFPKGTTCFLAPRRLLESAFAEFRSHYANVRLANDDTPVLRAVAARERIHISPEFSCTYAPRATLRSFFRHAVHRGTVFLDGHGTPESRYFPAVAAFFPASFGLAVAAVRRPALVPAALAACGAAAAAYGVYAGRSDREVEVLATVTPVYALGHALGMWRGVGELLR